MVLAAAWAPHIARFPTLWQYLQSVLAYVTPPVVAVFLAGLLWRRANRAGALAALGLGVPLGVAAWAANEVWAWTGVPYLYASAAMLGVSAVLLAVASLATAPPAAEQAALTWSPAQWRAESAELAGRPWYADPRHQSLGLLGLAAGLVVWWW
jgi:SSS family solute:Na+ symporter